METQRGEIDRWSDYYKSNKGETEKEILVAFYTRVSSDKEAQLHSLRYQQSWCEDILRTHPNYKLTQIYTDRGISGTQAKNRKGFLQAIEDGMKNSYEMLIVRDISRFARNCEESLKYTRMLKSKGTEILYYSDNIYSLDPEGDLLLSILSAITEQESKRISDKVLAGQHISRQKGVLYGTGNIMGYRLVKREGGNTYAIDEDQAETVRLIFDMYVNQGMGIKKISNALVERHRKNAMGEVRWDPSKVTRILSNKTLCGYLSYHKTQCISYLTHERKKVDKDEHIYVKADFPAIVTEDMWDKAQQIKESHSKIIMGRRTGRKRKQDKWNSLMVCSCGQSFKKYKWRTNKGTGEECYGFQCLNQVSHKRRDFIESNGLDGKGYCNVRCISEWSLELQIKRILERLWENPEATVDRLMQNIEEHYTEEEQIQDNTADLARLTREKKRQEIRLNNLVEMRIDEQIDKDTFNSKKAEITVRIAQIDNEIAELTVDVDTKEETVGHREEAIRNIRSTLENVTDISGKAISQELLSALVERVITCENSVFKWYMKMGMTSDDFSEDEYTLFDTFDILFEEARTYRKSLGHFLRQAQWKDIHVEIYMKID